MRTPLIAGNWKMNKTAGEARLLVDELVGMVRDLDDVDILVCPPFTAIAAVAEALKAQDTKILLGAQDVHWKPAGAYTGEISAGMLVDQGVRYVIIGHSERRQVCGEDNKLVNEKIKAALAGGLNPILCVGESLEQRDAGKTDSWVASQVFESLADVSVQDTAELVIAYEPIWAIGTGRTAEQSQANDTIRNIRAVVGSRFSPDAARVVRILYGGSVSPDNIGSFMGEPDIDGALVGGASLKADSFAQIAKFQRDGIVYQAR